MLDLLADWQLMFLIVQSVVIVIAAVILVKIFSRLVVRVAEERTRVKKGTLANVQRFFQLVVYSAAAILVLWIFNVDVTGLVAGLGIGALIIGFALKDLIENWVSGLLIISGKTYRVGDVIRVGNFAGVVTDISLRTTKLKTYDRSEIVIPNSTLLKEKIINLTVGKNEAVASMTFHIDYIFDIERAKSVIEDVLRSHGSVVVDKKRRREIRFIIRSKEWTTEIESLFWINSPENEEFIKSEITESTKKRFEKEKLFPTIPGVIRKEFLQTQI